MSNEYFLDALRNRHSVPSRQLCAPGPDDAELLQLLDLACRVPDHGRRVAWRFIRIAGTARASLGELLVERTRARDPDALPAQLDKERQRFNHAPVIMTVVAQLGPDGKIPAAERHSTAACVCFALLQAAQGLGFGAQWLTGWAAYDVAVREALGITSEEAIVGFIHIGNVAQAEPPHAYPQAAPLLTDWAGL